MIAFLSPAKNLRPALMQGLTPSRPRWMEQTELLLRLLRELSAWQLESLLSINPQLALRAWADYASFDPAASGSCAALSYYGLAYQRLDAATLSPDDLRHSDQCLRIFSAFYGPLRPTDGILPHRLDFFSRLRPGGKPLYAFWGDRFYRDLFSSGEPVVSLASAEYQKTVLPYLTSRDRMITCDFLVKKRGTLRCLPTAAKMARGAMARYLIVNRIERLQDLRGFDAMGFEFSPRLSNEERITFIQP